MDEAKIQNYINLFNKLNATDISEKRLEEIGEALDEAWYALSDEEMIVVEQRVSNIE